MPWNMEQAQWERAVPLHDEQWESITRLRGGFIRKTAA